MQKNIPALSNLTRRHFMKGTCGAMTSTSFLSTLMNLQATKTAVAAASNFTDYKALVCVFHHGGNDSFNMLAPYDDGEYNDYVSVRSGLALSKDPTANAPEGELLSVMGPGGRKFGVHHGMPEFKQLYDTGKLAFVSNVGSLIQPTTLQDYRSQSGLPLGLFSHSDEQRHWQTCVPQSRTQITGWAGRMADMLNDQVNSNPAVSMNIAVGHNNILQVGDNVIPYVISHRGGAQLVSGYNGTNTFNRIMTRAIDSQLQQIYTDLLEQAYASRSRNAIDAALEFNQAVNSVMLSTQFPDTSLGHQLMMTAKTIAARQQLGQTRQIFLVERGGWDHHSNLKNSQAAMLPEVSQALSAFYAATEELKVAAEVTTFSISDFSRTLTQNGSNGSDHAWGANHYVMGGAVQGGSIYGDYPTSLAQGNPLDVGRGRLIPTTSVDQYAAELAMWFGIGNGADLESILPNIRNFHSAGSSTSPLGFLG